MQPNQNHSHLSLLVSSVTLLTFTLLNATHGEYGTGILPNYISSNYPPVALSYAQQSMQQFGSHNQKEQETLEIAALAEAIADNTPLEEFRAREDAETVEIRNHERSSNGNGQKETSPVEFANERRRIKKKRLQEKIQANIDHFKTQDKAKTDAIKEKLSKKESLKVKQEESVKANAKKDKKEKQRKENKSKTSTSYSKSKRQNKARSTRTTGVFKTSIDVNEPCRFDGKAQVNCLQAKYNYCIQKKEQFCSIFDLKQAIKQLEPFPVGSKIEARWKKINGAFYSGKISNIHSDGTYDVEFDDNEKRINVPSDEIQKITKKSSTK